MNIPLPLLASGRLTPPYATRAAPARFRVDAFVANPVAGIINLKGEMLDRPHLTRAERQLKRIQRSKSRKRWASSGGRNSRSSDMIAAAVSSTEQAVLRYGARLAILIREAIAYSSGLCRNGADAAVRPNGLVLARQDVS
jgi:hypothetical protein